MTYDVQIGNEIRRGLTYAELIVLPLNTETYVRRKNSNWIQAKDCVELSHIVANDDTAIYQCDTIVQTSIGQGASSEYGAEFHAGCDLEDIHDLNDTLPDYVDSHSPNPLTSRTYENAGSLCEDVEEERVFIPTAEYFKCKQKRKTALIGVFTLGLAGLALMGVGNTWRSNIFEGLSFTKTDGLGFIFKCLSFLLLTALIAIPYFIYSVFALIYYSIRVNSLKR